MKIAIAGDSGGVSLVNVLAAHLASCKGVEVVDLSREPSGKSEYYANIAERVACAILAGEYDRGILCCGTGRVIGPELAKTIVNAWLASDFDPQGASAGNVAAIDELDKKYNK